MKQTWLIRLTRIQGGMLMLNRFNDDDLLLKLIQNRRQKRDGMMETVIMKSPDTNHSHNHQNVTVFWYRIKSVTWAYVLCVYHKPTDK